MALGLGFRAVNCDDVRDVILLRFISVTAADCASVFGSVPRASYGRYALRCIPLVILGRTSDDIRGNPYVFRGDFRPLQGV
jgi:hypothetical protein